MVVLVLAGASACATREDSGGRASEGVRTAEGIVVLGPDVPAKKDRLRDENELATSLVVGLTRSTDAMTYGEFVRARVARLCPSVDPARAVFSRSWRDGDPAYSIVLSPPGASPDGMSERCEQRRYVVGLLDWRDLSVETPTRDQYGVAVQWLEDFRAGLAPEAA